MAILVDRDTRVIVQGMTGRAGTFYTDLAVRYGSTYVGGVRPGKGGSQHIGLPVFNTVAEAVGETRATASLVMIPAPKAGPAIIEAIEAEVGVIVCVTERVPVHDVARVKAALKGSKSLLIGPNSQGILTPDACKIGVMPTTDATPGIVGIVSLTSEILAQTTALGLGQTTTVGIGGDAIHGLGFRKCLELFRNDKATKGVILIGEVGGTEEEDAAAYLASDDYGKPVVALVVGRHAPKERRMGHAGTLSIFGLESAAEKIERLASSGVLIAQNADEVAPRMKAALDAAG